MHRLLLKAPLTYVGFGGEARLQVGGRGTACLKGSMLGKWPSRHPQMNYLNEVGEEGEGLKLGGPSPRGPSLLAHMQVGLARRAQVGAGPRQLGPW